MKGEWDFGQRDGKEASVLSGAISAAFSGVFAGMGAVIGPCRSNHHSVRNCRDLVDLMCLTIRRMRVIVSIYFQKSYLVCFHLDDSCIEEGILMIKLRDFCCGYTPQA